MPQLKLRIFGSDGLTDQSIDSATRHLLKDVRVDVDPKAGLVAVESSPGTKGDVIGLGQIALAFVTGGPISKLVECLFGFLNRNRRLSIEIENSVGEKLKLNMDFVDHKGTKQAMQITREMLQRGH
jgi:hypothetical protein